jgi:hypothetical protein
MVTGKWEMRNYYKYGLEFISNVYKDLYNIEKILESPLLIYKWEPNQTHEKRFGKIINKNNKDYIVKGTDEIKTGMWLPFIRRSCNRWVRVCPAGISTYIKRNNKIQLKPMHMFFRNEQDLEEWLGKKYYQEMVIELI